MAADLEEAIAELRSALAEVARHDPDAHVTDDQMLGDFIAVCSWSTIDGNNADHTLVLPDRNAPPHHMLGLLHIGLLGFLPHDHD